jgi:uncharacterized membrane protein YfcA
VLVTLAILFAGSVAGCLGALLGIGGGFFLVPFLNKVLGLPWGTALGVSLVTVIGTSVTVSTSSAGRQLRNLRLGLILQMLTVLGATAGSAMHRYGLVSDRVAQYLFAVTAAGVAAVMLARLDRRNVLPATAADLGGFGGRFRDEDTGTDASYRVRRLPVAFGVSGAAGIVSSLTGLGGGIIVVPALNSWCGVPLRVAAATSTFVLGVTAIPGAIEHFPVADPLAPGYAAAAVLGVLAGSRAGLWIGPRVNVRRLKMLLAVILFSVAAKYLLG